VVYGASTWASRPALSGMSTRKYSRHSFQHTLLGRRRKSPVTPRSTPRNLRQRLDDEVPHPGFGRRRRESGRGMFFFFKFLIKWTRNVSTAHDTKGTANIPCTDLHSKSCRLRGKTCFLDTKVRSAAPDTLERNSFIRKLLLGLELR